MRSQSRAPRDAGGARPSWVNLSSSRPVSDLRLICFPPAGGGASRYREWPTHLPDHVEVLPVHLPGRESRFHEPAVDAMELLVGKLAEEVSSHLNRPFAFFGHSMGALLAFELIKRLRPMGFEPAHLFVAGCRAPHIPRREPDRHALPDREFVASVRALNGIPQEILGSTEFMEMMLPTLRSDFKLVETYVSSSQRPLDCAVTAFGGLRDNEVNRDELEAWSRHTTGSFALHMLPGDHFFVDSSRTNLLRLLMEELDPGHRPANHSGVVS